MFAAVKAFLAKAVGVFGKMSIANVTLAEATLIGDLVTDVTSLLGGVTSWATSIVTWIIGNEMARLFLAIMLLMLGIHFVKSFIRTA